MEALSRTVLVVDDDDDWRVMAADVLAEAGFVVAMAADGRAGLASWQQSRPQVVVTDVDMPLMDGRVLLATLHAIDRGVPVIVITGEDVSDAAAAFAGAFRVMQKPVPTDALVAAVGEALLSVPRTQCVASRGKKRARTALAMAAGFGAAAVAAVLIAVIRGSLV